MRVEEEAQLRREVVERQSRCERRFDVGNAVREGEGDLLDGGRSCFTNVVPRYRDGIPVRDFLLAVRERIDDEAHRWTRWIDVGTAGDVFLQDVVLNGPADLYAANALFLGDQLVQEQQRRRGGVDGHRRRDLVEW